MENWQSLLDLNIYIYCGSVIHSQVYIRQKCTQENSYYHVPSSTICNSPEQKVHQMLINSRMNK